MAPRKPKFGSPEIIFLFVAGLLALIVFTGNAGRLFHVLFSPVAVLIIVIMLFEYLLLKGSDRTEIYKREINAARLKRRDDLLALHEMEAQIDALRRRLDSALAEEVQAQADTGVAASSELREALHAARHAARALHEKIRERI